MYNSMLIGHYLSTTGVNNRNSTFVKQSKVVSSKNIGIVSHKAQIINENKKNIKNGIK